MGAKNQNHQADVRAAGRAEVRGEDRRGDLEPDRDEDLKDDILRLVVPVLGETYKFLTYDSPFPGKTWKKITVTAMGRRSCYYRLRLKQVREGDRYAMCQMTYRSWAIEVKHRRLKTTKLRPTSATLRYVLTDTMNEKYSDTDINPF